jgi:hypothetical protein
MTGSARPSTISRIGGVLLSITGSGLFIFAPIALFYLSALGCGMNTTGCRGFDFPWKEMALYALPVMVLAAGMIWGGWRMVRQPYSALSSCGLVIALGGIVASHLWMAEWYGSELLPPGFPWYPLLTICGPPLAVGAATMYAGHQARKRWLAASSTI